MFGPTYWGPDYWGQTYWPPGVGDDIGGTRRKERRKQEEFGRKRREWLEAKARIEALETAETEKAEAKRRIKRVYRRVASEAPEIPVLEGAVKVHAPRLVDQVGLPPEEAVKFDDFVRDTKALQELYTAYYDMIDEEEAVFVVMLLQ